jgi:hypothetical protein
MKEMIMWDKYDNKYRNVVDIEEVRNLEANLYEANNKISDLMDIIEEKDKMIDLMLEELTACEIEMKCSECTHECEKDYDSLYQCNKEYFEERSK